jgi:gliding motility-associated-like protein
MQNGTAKVEALNNSDVNYIEWDINGTVLTGPILNDLPAGEFTVTVYTTLQCEKTETFTVSSDISVYNAVSNNNDGKHDFFEIACIENFPQNHVRIFNRAGTLVYEAKGYDNAETAFSGTSNKGISLLGNSLPVGTYFYIIDKGDNSPAKTGYLELLH